MPRHRAPSSGHRFLPTFALTGVVAGGSLLLPPSALGSPAAAHTLPSDNDHGDRFHDDDHVDDRDDRGHADRARRGREAPRSRPMTSGERQYRNGCRQGYISEGCERFSIGRLVKRGINPSL